jgi:protocadherin Fat 1/2/3
MYNATILENSVGKVFVVPSEKMGIYNADPGVGIKYNIKGGDTDDFFKAQAEKVGDFVFLTIRTKTSSNNVLNRERTPSYLLEVKATFRDSENHRLRDIRASTTVRVSVLDTNDLDPFFNPSAYAVTVAEDTALHSSLIRVHADDADEGINGEVYYNFADDTDQFSLHPVSGVISLTRPLSYAQAKTHQLVVEARDRGSTNSLGPRRVDTASVVLTVAQVNLHDPVMTVQHLPEVIEQSHADIYAIIHITDPDLGQHGEVASVEIIEGDPDAHFRVRPGSEPGDFNVEVLKLLDREVSPHGYNLTVKATDGGRPSR